MKCIKGIAISLSFFALSMLTYAGSMNSASEDSIFYPSRERINVAQDILDKIENLKFQSASEQINGQIKTAKRRNESTEGLERALKLCNKGNSGLRGTDRVLIVDSIVVDKKSFLKAYPLSDDMGTLAMSSDKKTVSYQTQLNGITFVPEVCDSTQQLRLVRYYSNDGIPLEPMQVEGLGIEGDINYPFLMADGQTLYFAARTLDGFGNYDLYVTRYDSDSKRYYVADNLGYPYNSCFNDYMMVIDEVNNIGWFASDRYQPIDKVCVYTFIPNQSRRPFDYENESHDVIRQAASLHSINALIGSTEGADKQLILNAKVKLKQTKMSHKHEANKEFEFELNGNTTYTSMSQFKNPEARTLVSEWVQMTKNRYALTEQLNTARQSYTSGSGKEAEIINLEKRIKALNKEIVNIENRIRKAELL